MVSMTTPGARTLLLVAALLTPAAARADQGAPTPTPTRDGVVVDRPEVVLRWTASQEDGVYGYLVYRADRREGPFRRVNQEIIHVERDQSEGAGAYRFVDTAVEAGRTYFYYLDAVSMGGLKQRLSGVISKEVAGVGER
jgi:hypothetical protein